MDLAYLVHSNNELKSLCTKLKTSRYLALDTEFERSRTFFVRPALVQMSDGKNTYLLDPLRIDNWTPFIRLLNDSNITKILHSSSEDLDVFERLGGSPPTNLFDTQIAASMLGYGYSISYRALVRKLFDVDLPKSETRSNWLRRPLSRAQLDYARMDVDYLPSIYERLNMSLYDRGRNEWIREEYSRLVNRHRDNQNVELAYCRIGRNARLGRRAIGVLRAVAAWREHEAKKRDCPRNYVVRDNQLLKIAKSLPTSLEELEKSLGDGVTLPERDRTVIVRIVNRVLELDDTQLPNPHVTSGNLREHEQTIKNLRDVVTKTAQSFEIAPELLAHRRALEDLVREVLVKNRRHLTDYFGGWRASVVGEQLLELLLSS